MSVRLTEKKLEDFRFREREEAIFKAFFDEGGGRECSVNWIVKKVGIDRATFYRHHRSVYEIVPDYECYIMTKFERFVKTLMEKDGIHLRQMYNQTLMFILRHRKIMKVLIEQSGIRVVEAMILQLKPRMVVDCRALGYSERAFKVYLGEVVCLIREWSMAGFNEKEMPMLISNIMYLTGSVRERLLPLGG